MRIARAARAELRARAATRGRHPRRGHRPQRRRRSGGGRRAGRSTGRAAQAGRPGRLLDQRGDAAGAGARRARRVRSPSGWAPRWRTAAAPISSASRSPARGSSTCSSSDGWYRRALRTVLEAGRGVRGAAALPAAPSGCCWSSSRPTRPVRWWPPTASHAAYGDALARILAHHGHDVSREYYFNDAGSQIRRLGESVVARARGEEPCPRTATRASTWPSSPTRSDGAAEHAGGGGRRPRGAALLIDRSSTTLERYGVHYDRFFSERTLHEGSPCYMRARAGARRARAGTRTSPTGALWLRSTTFGDDNDRVLRRTGRRADLPGGRPRLPAGEARARLRPPDHSGGRPTITATCRG